MFIHSIGRLRPENAIDNQFLPKPYIGIDDDWADSGIRPRHTVLPLGYVSSTRNCDSRFMDETAACVGAAVAFAGSALMCVAVLPSAEEQPKAAAQ